MEYNSENLEFQIKKQSTLTKHKKMCKDLKNKESKKGKSSK